MKNMCVLILLLTLPAAAAARDRTSWENAAALSPGEGIQVDKKSGEAVKGSFVRAEAEAIILRDAQQELTVPRSEVSRIRLRSRGSHKAVWIGLAIGGGAGAGIGAGAGAALSNASGGDFSSLQPAITGVCAAAGALAGLAIGSVVDGRRNTIYRAR